MLKSLLPRHPPKPPPPLTPKIHPHRPLTTTPKESKGRPQKSLPAAYYRGGTSRAVIFDRAHLPKPNKNKEAWAPIFRAVIGSPDAAHKRQLDGMGGGISSLSKVCIVSGTPTHPAADVDYTFVSLGVVDDHVDYTSNCGNMSAAIGPFAVDSGVFKPALLGVGEEGEVTVRIHNTNTGKIIHSTFPVVRSEMDPGLVEAATSGDFEIDGVTGSAARIQLDFLDPAGSVTGTLLPTGREVDVFEVKVEGTRGEKKMEVEATCIDVGNPCVFVRAADLGVRGNLTPDELTADLPLLEKLNRIRRQAGVEMGIASTPEAVPGSIPKICMVAAPGEDARSVEKEQTPQRVDLVARALSVGQPHKALPITVALSLAAAARVEGSTVAQIVNGKEMIDAAGITIGHASGNLLVGAAFAEDGALKSGRVFSTARRLFEGRVFWKDEQ
ncbi:DUF453 domain protein [Aspergillus homomorphus CBS 101889]|uniref:DUF453-domain-containing protein n=1 Tax=Aspergillus homomorphus (strain CBS 101889) TaxID=1450537 RepID=A0A395HWH6_ASPHC|nr:DUF453-domain-containing protein [Aspergillus homomorphus CBS 101889]RAL11198.1 DUF453-domain-containing protein [Aspergillus homomorphus CBS 101889]